MRFIFFPSACLRPFHVRCLATHLLSIVQDKRSLSFCTSWCVSPLGENDSLGLLVGTISERNLPGKLMYWYCLELYHGRSNEAWQSSDFYEWLWYVVWSTSSKRADMTCVNLSTCITLFIIAISVNAHTIRQHDHRNTTRVRIPLNRFMTEWLLHCGVGI